MKKSSKIILSAISSVILLTLCFCVGLNLKNKHDIKKYIEDACNTSIEYTDPSDSATFLTTQLYPNAKPQEFVDLPVETDEQKLQRVADAINELKSGQIAFIGTAYGIENTAILECSVPLVTGTLLNNTKKYVDSCLDKVITQENAFEMLPPCGKQCKFSPDSVSVVTSWVSGYCIYYNIILKGEFTLYPETSDINSAVDLLNLDGLPNVKCIDQASYGETLIEAVFRDNRLIFYNIDIPVGEISVKGHINGIYGTASFTGNLSQHWDFQY